MQKKDDKLKSHLIAPAQYSEDLRMLKHENSADRIQNSNLQHWKIVHISDNKMKDDNEEK